MLIKSSWLKDNTPYTPDQTTQVLDKISCVCKYVGSGKTKYLNIPISFDCETTSFYDKNGEKTAIMYIWMLGVCGLVIVGRTWEEWLYTYNQLTEYFRTCGKRIAICYIHNMSFDFQFLRKHHNIEKVFAIETYQPLYAITREGIEFRCSYKLSGYGLETLAKNLLYHKIRKLKGDLDYRQIRHSQTPITDEEMLYCLNDAKIVNAYIDELLDRGGDISQLPLTKTGFVRNLSRRECFADRNYKYIVQSLELTAPEFELCKNAFQGGYVHANADCVGKTLHDVTPLDIISSYPATMFDELFPMSNPQHIKIKSVKDLKYYCDNYCCIFTITLNDVKPRYWFDFYISSSKCKIYGKRVLSNGRVVSCDALTTTITNVDYDIISYMYKYDMDNICISDFIIFKRDYLPTSFVKSLIEMYQKKTELKGVEGKEIEYLVSKENQNSYYGMTVTSPVRDIYKYENMQWLEKETPDLETAIEKYNNDHNRFLYYPWGVFVTAYARHNIWEAIIECGYDHCYSDTDSEYCLNFSAHAEFFKEYNNRVMEKHKRACKVHNIPIEMVTPKTKKGVVKMLGAFDPDPICETFKTQGAKRYLKYTEGKYIITVAGMNKTTGIDYLLKTYGDGIFDSFKDGLVIPSQYSGRLIHTYIDETREGDITDLYGNTCHYKELSCIHLEPTTYHMGITTEFDKFIKNIREGFFPWQS